MLEWLTGKWHTVAVTYCTGELLWGGTKHVCIQFQENTKTGRRRVVDNSLGGSIEHIKGAELRWVLKGILPDFAEII